MGTLRNSIAALVASLGLATASAPASADIFSWGMQGPWSGFYVGVNAGGAWGETDATYTAGPAGLPSHDIDGGIYGIHWGNNWQFGSLVVGTESSISGWDKIEGTGLNAPLFAAAFDFRSRINSIWTSGGRIGWAPNERWLLFAAGGYASGRIFTSDVIRVTNVDNAPDSERHEGTYYGGGVDVRFGDRWIFGVEYRHIDLDEEQHNIQTSTAIVAGITRDVEAELDMVRARLSLQLGPLFGRRN